MSTLGVIALVLLAIFVGLIVLRVVVSVALFLFWPLVFITAGGALVLWFLSRKG
ncbi:MAG: hypothetical protein RIB67_05735 [Miltoncostaeaceae bacterium]